MADNYANPLKEAETDIGKATKAISGLLDPKKETVTETKETETKEEEAPNNSCRHRSQKQQVFT